MVPWKELCMGLSSFAALATLIFYVLPKWRTWHIQCVLNRRAALATPRPQGLTVAEKHVLTQKARRTRIEGVRKGAALRSKTTFYIVWSALILITIVMILLALRQGFQSWEPGP